jgi:hypothetical protein
MVTKIKDIDSFKEATIEEFPHLSDELNKKTLSYYSVKQYIRKVAVEIVRLGCKNEAYQKEISKQLNNLEHHDCIVWGKTYGGNERFI